MARAISVPRWLIAVRTELGSAVSLSFGVCHSDRAEAEMVKAAFVRGAGYVVVYGRRPDRDAAKGAIERGEPLTGLPGALRLIVRPENASAFLPR